jgi:hypothetical protein
MNIKCAHCGADNPPFVEKCGACGSGMYGWRQPYGTTLGGVLGAIFVAAGLIGMARYGFLFDVSVMAGEAGRVVNQQLMNERLVMMVASVGCLVFGGILGARR